MMLERLGPALALMLLLEGVVPLFSPRTWRVAIRRITDLADGQIRFFGLSSMVLGALLFWLLS
ncbi:MAG TPA: DUF2065 family protein [Burkholderiaceae bacterium]|jgi:uncharacterized protein YjeT (DUF2065 family)|nr:DUF2065 family protein [Burkholderiaceae bacterium]